jgi:hypothetical protein
MCPHRMQTMIGRQVSLESHPKTRGDLWDLLIAPIWHHHLLWVPQWLGQHLVWTCLSMVTMEAESIILSVSNPYEILANLWTDGNLELTKMAWRHSVTWLHRKILVLSSQADGCRRVDFWTSEATAGKTLHACLKVTEGCVCEEIKGDGRIREVDQ